MQPIVINADFGGFSLSKEAYLRLRALGHSLALQEEDMGQGAYLTDIPRDDLELVSVVTDLGEKANGPYASLKIVQVPDDVEWEIEEFDGNEQVVERHRTWS